MLARVANLEEQLVLQREELKKQSGMISKIFDMMSALHGGVPDSDTIRGPEMSRNIDSPTLPETHISGTISSTSSPDEKSETLSETSTTRNLVANPLRNSSGSMTGIKRPMGPKRRAIRATRRFIKQYYENVPMRISKSASRRNESPVSGTKRPRHSSSENEDRRDKVTRPSSSSAPALSSLSSSSSSSSAGPSGSLVTPIPSAPNSSLARPSPTAVQVPPLAPVSSSLVVLRQSLLQCESQEELQLLLRSTPDASRKGVALQLLHALNTQPNGPVAPGGESCVRGRDFYRDFLCFHGGLEVFTEWMQSALPIVTDITPKKNTEHEETKDFISTLLKLMDQVSWSHALVVKTRIDKIIRSFYKLYVAKAQELESKAGSVSDSADHEILAKSCTEFSLSLRDPWSKYRELFLSRS